MEFNVGLYCYWNDGRREKKTWFSSDVSRFLPPPRAGWLRSYTQYLCAQHFVKDDKDSSESTFFYCWGRERCFSRNLGAREESERIKSSRCWPRKAKYNADKRGYFSLFITHWSLLFLPLSVLCWLVFHCIMHNKKQFRAASCDATENIFVNDEKLSPLPARSNFHVCHC